MILSISIHKTKTMESSLLKNLNDLGQLFISRIVLEHSELKEDTLKTLWSELTNISGKPAQVESKSNNSNSICQAIYKSGHNKGMKCTTVTQNGSAYCGRHTPKIFDETKPLCKMVLRDGNNCRKPPTKNSEYCGVHAKDAKPVTGSKVKKEKDPGPYIFNSDDMKKDNGDYERKSQRSWKHVPTGYRVKKTTGDKYYVDGLFDIDENGEEVLYHLDPDEEPTLHGIEFKYQKE